MDPCHARLDGTVAQVLEEFFELMFSYPYKSSVVVSCLSLLRMIAKHFRFQPNGAIVAPSIT